MLNKIKFSLISFLLLLIFPLKSFAAELTYAQLPSLQPGGKTLQLKPKGKRIIDLGRNTSGRLQVRVLEGTVRISYSESLAMLKSGGDLGEFKTQSRSDAPESRVDIFRKGLNFSPGLRGGVRYLLLESKRRTIIDSIAMRSKHLSLANDKQTYFASSSALLNKIWHAGKRTLELSTSWSPNGWLVTDAAKRDHLPWLGDLEMENLAATYASKRFDTALTRTLTIFACQQYSSGYIPMTTYTEATCSNPGPADGPLDINDPLELMSKDVLPAYTAAWVSAVKERFLFNGNRQWVSSMLPVMQRTIDYYQDNLDEQGLFSKSGGINWRAFDQVQAIDTYTNTAWLKALRALAYVEAELDKHIEASAHSIMADTLKEAINKYLFDDYLYRGGDSTSYFQDGNIGAVLAGASDYPSGILDNLRQTMFSRFGPVTATRTTPYAERFVSPFMSGWHLIASLDNNRVSEARWMLKRLWGRMAQSDPGTMWEAMGTDGRPIKLDRGRLPGGITSLAHGWSAAPTYALPAYITGIKPTSPGWKTWQVKPIPFGLKHAKASVPTPQGNIKVAWRKRNKQFILKVIIPGNSRGIVYLPCKKPQAIKRSSVIKCSLQ